MNKENAIRLFSFCIDVARFYIVVFMLIYLGWLSQSGAFYPMGHILNLM